jgi:hypothetical protein
MCPTEVLSSFIRVVFRIPWLSLKVGGMLIRLNMAIVYLIVLAILPFLLIVFPINIPEQDKIISLAKLYANLLPVLHQIHVVI